MKNDFCRYAVSFERSRLHDAPDSNCHDHAQHSVNALTLCVYAIGATQVAMLPPISCHRYLSSSPLSAAMPKIAFRVLTGAN